MSAQRMLEALESDFMYADYKSGMSLVQVAAKYHYHPHTVWSRFKSLGLKARPAGGRKRKAVGT